MRDPRRPVHRGVYILPNLFTTASLFGGFLSMIMSMAGNYDLAAVAIMLAAILDGLDGKVARLTGSASQFGIEYDSLADMISFGAAPAILAWSWQLTAFGRLGIGASFLFLACAGLRLARFNVDAGTGTKKFFIGLPSPACGCTLAAWVVFQPYLPNFLVPYLPYLTLGLAFVVPLLMVSRVRYFSFKEYGFLRAHPFRSLVISLMFFILLFSAPRLLLFLFGLLYILSGLIFSFLILPRRNRQILRHLTQS